MPLQLARRSNRHPFVAARRRRRLGALALALSTALPVAAVAQRPAESSLRAADSALARRAAAGMAALQSAATSDVVLLFPGAPIVRGRAAMAALLHSVGATHDRLAWSARRADVSADGTRGYTYGRGTRTLRPSGPDSTDGFRYVAWWRHDDGAWRVAALLVIAERANADSSARWPCTSVTPPVMRASSDAAREVVVADSLFAARSSIAGPAVAFAEYVADDGVSLGDSGAPACGKQAVGAQLAGAAPRELAWSPMIADAAASGDLGYTVGTATIQGTHGVRYSKYLTVWKRQHDGTWRFVVDGGSAAPARQGALAAR